ncbi:hypothetical protein BH23ACT10_BH23ACT10_17570 [soil metagenome]
MTDLKRTVVMGLVIVGLLAQYGLSLLFGEPYPAIRYPAFQTIYGNDGWIDVTVRRVVVCAGTDPRPVELEALLSPIPQSFIPNTIETLTDAAEVQVDEAGAPLRPGVRVIDGDTPRERTLIDWLQGRLDEQLGALGEDGWLAIYEVRRRMSATRPDVPGADRVADVMLIDLDPDGSSGLRGAVQARGCVSSGLVASGKPLADGGSGRHVAVRMSQ